MPDTVCEQLPSGPMSRDDLKAFCLDPTISNEACFAAIMAWGAMKYDRFREMRSRRRRSGMGPAYFTKLIFFGDPRNDGYIMDQWTSLSINLLSASGPIVHRLISTFRGRRTDTVSDRRDASTYARFCSAIEEVGRLLGCSAEAAEQHLFSQGDGNPPRGGVMCSSIVHDLLSARQPVIPKPMRASLRGSRCSPLSVTSRLGGDLPGLHRCRPIRPPRGRPQGATAPARHGLGPL